MTKFNFNSFADRQSAAAEARKALLEKFKNRPPEDSPEVQARKAERAAILRAREEREAAKAAAPPPPNRPVSPRSRPSRKPGKPPSAPRARAQLEAERAAREAARANLVTRAIMDQMDWKAQRLAARKKR